MKVKHIVVSVAIAVFAVLAVALLYDRGSSDTKTSGADNASSLQADNAVAKDTRVPVRKKTIEVGDSGFRKAKWGSGKKALGGYRIALSAEDAGKKMEAVEAVGDPKVHAGVNVDYLRYVYVNDELMAVEMGAKGREKFFQFLGVALGENPDTVTENMSKREMFYMGSIGNVTVSVQYEEEGDISRLAYISMPVLSKHEDVVEDVGPKSPPGDAEWQNVLNIPYEKPVCVK